MFKSIIRFVQGFGYFLLGKEPDEIKLARAEAEIRQQEAQTMQALEESGSLIATYEREVITLEPQVQEMESNIRALLAAGREDLASELASEFEELETRYLIAKDTLKNSKEDLKVRHEEAEIAMNKLATRFKNIKDNRKRAKIDERLNSLRKATSSKRFDTSGLQEDLIQLDERTKEKLDRNAGTRMVLDLGTEKAKAAVEKEQAIKAATGKSKLARFAATRGITLPAEKIGTPPLLGTEETKA